MPSYQATVSIAHIHTAIYGFTGPLKYIMIWVDCAWKIIYSGPKLLSGWGLNTLESYRPQAVSISNHDVSSTCNLYQTKFPGWVWLQISRVKFPNVVHNAFFNRVNKPNIQSSKFPGNKVACAPTNYFSECSACTCINFLKSFLNPLKAINPSFYILIFINLVCVML